MIGAVIGDIVGSIYEFANIKTKEFPLFSERSKWTDDTILSMATAQWILDGAKTDEVGNYYHRFATDYPNPMGGYGTGFLSWLHAGDREFTLQFSHRSLVARSCGFGDFLLELLRLTLKR